MGILIARSKTAAARAEACRSAVRLVLRAGWGTADCGYHAVRLDHFDVVSRDPDVHLFKAGFEDFLVLPKEPFSLVRLRRVNGNSDQQILVLRTPRCLTRG